MDKFACFIVLGLMEFLALLFQSIGLFAPAWVILDMNMNVSDTHLTEKVRLGLFSGEGCFTLDYSKQCTAFSVDFVYDVIYNSDQPDSSKTSSRPLRDYFLTLQLLVIFGGIASITAVCTVIAYMKISTRDSTRKRLGIFGACLWISSGTLLISAVGFEVSKYIEAKNENLNDELPEISGNIQAFLYFPWAACMTGIGAVLCFVSSLILSIWMCHDKGDTGTVGTWSKFTNQAI